MNISTAFPNSDEQMSTPTNSIRTESPIRKAISTTPMSTSPIEDSPTSVMMDVVDKNPEDFRELKRLWGYSEQLLIPEEMITGNDLITVWNIDDEVKLKAVPNYQKVTSSMETPRCQVPSWSTTDRSDMEETFSDFTQLKIGHARAPFRSFPLPSPESEVVSDRGSTSTIVLSDDRIDTDKEMEGSAKPQRRGHKRTTHRRNDTHFEFEFR